MEDNRIIEAEIIVIAQLRGNKDSKGFKAVRIKNKKGNYSGGV